MSFCLFVCVCVLVHSAPVQRTAATARRVNKLVGYCWLIVVCGGCWWLVDFLVVVVVGGWLLVDGCGF